VRALSARRSASSVEPAALLWPDRRRAHLSSDYRVEQLRRLLPRVDLGARAGGTSQCASTGRQIARVEGYSGMQVHLHDSAREFVADAEPLLQEDPFSTNVIAVAAGRAAAGDEPDSSNMWATVKDGEGRLVGVAMHTPPHHLFVSQMPAEAASALADTLADASRDLPGVNGAVESTGAFAETWTARTGQPSALVTAMRMYRLGQLVLPLGVPGEAAMATARDIELITGWFAAFHDEAQPHTPIADWRALVERRVGGGQIHLWRDDDACVALAGVSAPAAGVARVGPVYTPPRWRRRGYGAAVTAHATAAALRAGARHVVLYTDLANPTSNSIYQQIGYRPDHDAEERAFR
jgi:predicted GNAT family acetyltransferase